ncbi:hypothetical protein GTP46_08780 [Duganella sp. FT135W]|uniref:Uncharacterized protein n=1 Tax=Duganella flavida TaxID=2692175 RepID=A0A6L8K842_9BURK|nr:DUF6624 domain-containing protein [Duganella flavida]MYM22737.1 hypothetical protein [Duganella flavida]
MTKFFIFNRYVILILISLIWHTDTFAAIDCHASFGRLKEMVSKDQQIREEWELKSQGKSTSNIINEDLQKRWQAIDASNILELKEIISTCGWPTNKEGSHNAWLLSQHADSDIAFQHYARDLLEVAFKNGNASAQDLAYLSDRIATAEGRPQEYGTQFMLSDRCNLEARPVDSIAAVDQRRRALGLQSLAEYLEEGRKRFIPSDCNHGKKQQKEAEEL